MQCSKKILFDHLVGDSKQRRRHVQADALAVLRLITSSNLVGCSTGSSAGLAPLKILSRKAAARSSCVTGRRYKR